MLKNCNTTQWDSLNSFLLGLSVLQLNDDSEISENINGGGGLCQKERRKSHVTFKKHEEVSKLARMYFITLWRLAVQCPCRHPGSSPPPSWVAFRVPERTATFHSDEHRLSLHNPNPSCPIRLRIQPICELQPIPNTRKLWFLILRLWINFALFMPQNPPSYSSLVVRSLQVIEGKQIKHVKHVHAPAQRFPKGTWEIYETWI